MIDYDGLLCEPSLSHHFSITFVPSRCHSALLMHIVSVGVTDSSHRGNRTFPPWETDFPSVGNRHSLRGKYRLALLKPDDDIVMAWFASHHDLNA